MEPRLSRRSFLLTSIPALVMLRCASAASVDKTRLPYSDPVAADSWIVSRKMAAKTPVDTLHLSRFKDRMYVLTETIGWKSSPGQPVLPSITVPVGFVTDFASIPRIFWTLLPPDGDYTYPAVLHDYLYWFQFTTRLVADNILNAAMADFKIDKPSALAIYEGVRLGGQSSWDENARLKMSGERRVLREYPRDPTATWSEWKKNPSHFL